MPIVRVQEARGQYRVTIPKDVAEKAGIKKGTPFFVILDGENIILKKIPGP